MMMATVKIVGNGKIDNRWRYRYDDDGCSVSGDGIILGIRC